MAAEARIPMSQCKECGDHMPTSWRTRHDAVCVTKVCAHTQKSQSDFDAYAVDYHNLKQRFETELKPLSRGGIPAAIADVSKDHNKKWFGKFDGEDLTRLKNTFVNS